jgi:hypothetical protein
MQEIESSGASNAFIRYFQNRFLDFNDVIRLQLKAGPGVAARLRMTDYLSFYLGNQKNVHAGIPGPRFPDIVKKPWGTEQEKGFVFFGVNATDDFPNQPVYSPTEFDIGVHALLVGADIGFDLVEFFDLIGGFVAWDGDRLEYVKTNFNYQLINSVEDIDTLFATGESTVPEKPTSKFRFGLHLELEEDDGVSASVDPDFNLEVSLPNLESRWDLFITGRDQDELPDTDPSDREEASRIGLKRQIGDLNIKTEAGVQFDWPPVAFANIAWRPKVELGEWGIKPRIKGYYDTEDGFGQITSLNATRWFTEMDRWIFRSTSSGKWAENTDGWEWRQSVAVAHVDRLLDESRRRSHGINRDDAYKGTGLRYTIFGHIDAENVTDRHRLTLTHIRPLKKKTWILMEISPEIEFENENDWDPTYQLRFGFDLLFWGFSNF